MLLFLMLACVSCTRAPEAEPDAPCTDDAQRAAFDAMIARDDARTHEIIARRHLLDSSTLAQSCAYHVALPFDDAREAWLHSWCAWHKADWSLLLDTSTRALRYFELAGQGRRVIEMHLMRAHAASMLRRTDQHREELAAAQQWLLMTGELLPATHDDPVPGDLPFLLAMHVARGEDVRIASGRAPHDAARLFEHATDDYRRYQSPGALAMSWRAHGLMRLERGDVSGAASLIQRALLLDLDGGNATALSRDLQLISMMADALGQPALGTRVLDYLLDEGTLPPTHILSPETMPHTSPELLGLGQHREGRRQLLLALRSTRRTPAMRTMKARLLSMYEGVDALEEAFSPMGYELVAEIGLAFAERGERESARRYLAHAVGLLERVRREIGSLHVRQDFTRTWWPYYMALVHQKVGIDTDRLTQRDYQETAALVGAVKARGLRDLLEGWETTPFVATRDVEAIAILPPTLHGAPRALMEDVLRTLALWRISPAASAAAYPQPVGYPLESLDGYYGPSHLGELIPKGAVALDYVLGERKGYVMVVHDDGRLSMRQVAGRQEIAPLFEAFKAGLLSPELSPEAYRAHRELAERLYVALIAPVQDLIVGHERLYIAPDAMLHDLPFEALAHPSTHATPDYLFMHHTMSYVPSMHVWTLLHARASRGTMSDPTAEITPLLHARASRASSSPPSALLFGAPTLDQPSLDLLALARDVPGDGLRAMSELFATLPGGSRELSTVARSLRGQGFVTHSVSGEQATERALMEEGGEGHALIHIATHGLSDAHPWNRELEVSMGMQQPALLLGQEGAHDGIWRLEEVLGFGSRARVVVLSGCTTGRGWRALGDGAYGLAGAFLFTGNQTVVASSWSVSDEATYALMSHMYAHLDGRLDAADAMSQGRRAWFEEHRRRGEQLPPFYWAAFRVMGE